MEYVLIGLGVLVALIVGIMLYAATKPGSFQVERSKIISAPPERIYPLIEDFHNWLGWSPWEKLDPNLQRTFSGTPRGLGSIYEWEGNKKVGKGRMEITHAVPAKEIVIKLDFFKPFEAHNTTQFDLADQGGSTEVKWTMLGQQPFMMKVMTTLFLNMDKLVGADFEKGLAKMKELSEAAIRTP